MVSTGAASVLDNRIHTVGEDKAARHMEGIADIAAVLVEADFCFVPVVVVLVAAVAVPSNPFRSGSKKLNYQVLAVRKSDKTFCIPLPALFDRKGSPFCITGCLFSLKLIGTHFPIIRSLLLRPLHWTHRCVLWLTELLPRRLLHLRRHLTRLHLPIHCLVLRRRLLRPLHLRWVLRSLPLLWRRSWLIPIVLRRLLSWSILRSRLSSRPLLRLISLRIALRRSLLLRSRSRLPSRSLCLIWLPWHYRWAII